MSKTWHQRPSSLLAIDDPYWAWCIDEVTYIFGTHCEAEMDRAEAPIKNVKAKAQARMNALTRILESKPKTEGDDETGETEAKPITKGRFRDPASMFKK